MAQNEGQRIVYLLNLTDQGAPDLPGSHSYVRLPPPTDPNYTLRISIQGTSSICRQGSLWTNLPQKKGDKFDRNKFREFKLKPDFNRSIQIDTPIVCAGAFAFYTTYSPLPEFSIGPVVNKPEPTSTPTYFIDVSPRLSLNDSPLPLDSLSIFSIISKFMGKTLTDWDKHFRGIGGRGYNMVHFTPLMKRGSSNSPYSLYDQQVFDDTNFPNGERDVADMISRMEKDFGLLGLTDVVWNHTANNSSWLEDHPEAGYNLETAPWLESAYELDTALLKYGSELGSLGLPIRLSGLADLEKIMDGIKTQVITGIRLWEFYVINVPEQAAQAVKDWSSGTVDVSSTRFGVSDLREVKDWPLKRKADWIIQNGLNGNDRLGERFRRSLKPNLGAGLIAAMFGQFDPSQEEEANMTIQSMLNECNVRFYNEYDAELAVIFEQLYNRIKYVRLDDHGPKLGAIDSNNPLIETYFTRLPENEKTNKHNQKALSLVNNGWIWAADAMNDNAGPFSRAYLRREVIVWTDCVKLRYGEGPEDSPFLWEFMAKYTRLMAKYFVGFRIDNCHSTPLHLAEYMLDQARGVRPDLAVFAELFTGNEATDFVFVQRLGLSSLIREAMQAGSTAEVSRLVHRHGGIPIGSFEIDEIANVDEPNDTASEIVRTIRTSPVHALFYDCTHDNEVPAQKRDARDTLPNSALVAMCSCATGSVMGYDEIYPKLIELVQETRLYSSVFSDAPVESQAGNGGIGGIKKLLNQIHVLMGKDGYDETYIDHKDQYITVHRVQPQSRQGYFLIAHTAFRGYGTERGAFDPVHLQGTRAKLLGSWTLEVDDSQDIRERISGDKLTLKGLPSRTREIAGVTIEHENDNTNISIPNDFPPGSIALFETWVPGAEHSDGLDIFVTTGAKNAFAGLNMIDLNYVLYRCDAEEKDSSGSHDGVYTIPNFGPLVYAGLQGWWSVLRDIVKNNNLGHPLCNHLREGHWALDYCARRLERISKQEGFGHLKLPAAWLRERFDAITKLPTFLLPRYFAMVIRTAYSAAVDRGIKLMTKNIRTGQPFLQSLAMVSVQMTGYMNSTSLYPTKSVPCLAAGLPHFAYDWARCWGRDVFISLRGLFLGTGRFDDAREHIHGFGSVLKHGMIPNLLSAGRIPRYNSRDSVWFFLQNIQDFTKMVPDGINILQDSVKRRFLPYDDTWFEWDDPRAYSKSSTIEEIIQEALQRHATGISFREANAGPGIDSQMRDQGFQIDVHVDWNTGIIFGGNQFNCGTWMDKMGESEKAGSKGIPGTPRDGAAVEITGMLYSALVWVDRLHNKGQYAFNGVKTSNGEFITFGEWATKIKDNFEKCYYIPLSASDDGNHVVNPRVVNRRGIYKDLYKSGKEYEDYQLRPNFPIAMCVAPDLFDPEHALEALSLADSVLLGQTGMATLDPADLNYRPNYINSEDSTDFHTSKGRNYHQGPEWLWPTGFFLRALLRFDLMRKKTPEERVGSYQQITRRLAGCQKMIKETPWAGLTELTNFKNSYCSDSCPTQAWSAGCLIDLFHDAQELPVD